MRKLILNSLINIFVFYLMAMIFTSVNLGNYVTAVWAGIILALLNLVVRPLLVIVALPLNIITMGIFILVINTWMVMLTDKIVPGLHIGSFWMAFGVALIITVVKQAISSIISNENP